ncbi:hypothetical protein MRX96_051340 [Rhipicephalus microplus]
MKSTKDRCRVAKCLPRSFAARSSRENRENGAFARSADIARVSRMRHRACALFTHLANKIESAPRGFAIGGEEQRDPRKWAVMRPKLCFCVDEGYSAATSICLRPVPVQFRPAPPSSQENEFVAMDERRS